MVVPLLEIFRTYLQRFTSGYPAGAAEKKRAHRMLPFPQRAIPSRVAGQGGVSLEGSAPLARNHARARFTGN